MGLVAPRHVGSSRIRDWTRVPYIGRWILNHCATRETLIRFLFKLLSSIIISKSLLKCSILSFISLNGVRTVISEPPKSSSCFCTCLLYRTFSTYSQSNAFTTKLLTSLLCLKPPTASPMTFYHPPLSPSPLSGSYSGLCAVLWTNQAFFCLRVFLFAISSVWNIPSPNNRIAVPFSDRKSVV